MSRFGASHGLVELLSHEKPGLAPKRLIKFAYNASGFPTVDYPSRFLISSLTASVVAGK